MRRQTLATRVMSASKLKYDAEACKTSKVFRRTQKKTWWNFLCAFFTFLIPNFVLSFFGMKDKNARHAWREKFCLCSLIALACCLLAFLTYGMTMFVCKDPMVLEYSRLQRQKVPMVVSFGRVFIVSNNHENFDELSSDHLQNVSPLFRKKIPACETAFDGRITSKDGPRLKDSDLLADAGELFFSWNDIYKKGYAVIDGVVIDGSFVDEPFYDDFFKKNKGKDGSTYAKTWTDAERECLKQEARVGRVKIKSKGCLLADLVLYASTVAIFGLIIVRFVLATFYYWRAKTQMKRLSKKAPADTPTILLVTAYSEDEHGLKCTLESLANQRDESEKRVCVIVADGAVKGSSSNATTPELLRKMVKPQPGYPRDPADYIALAPGDKRHNRASVIPAFYEGKSRTLPVILVLKEGSEKEQGTAKAGNRGKRDSQVLIMGFFQRLAFNDLFVPLDAELYRALVTLRPMVDPCSYEAILMVDADTVVADDAVSQMLALLKKDTAVVGLCGETRIVNKGKSWVTAIQVFEYYISHHLSKAFESIFGGVTCIPGCFGMYRLQELKTVRGEVFSLPILCHPLIVNAYSSIDTRTLHQKNLLLLGEDRFLTTLLLKHFFHRKLVFCPTAHCYTEVPSDFSVLLSQRRRWINSTVHNYFELAMVDQLCGTFCCSMKFVVLMELSGTLVLPAAIIFTGILIVKAIISEPAWIPLIMLFGILGLPAILIGLTTFDLTQIFWLFIYILSLPIWNFVLPTYAFWHFDDFTWGETRKILGDKTNEHGESKGKYDLKECKVGLLSDILKKDPIPID